MNYKILLLNELIIKRKKEKLNKTIHFKINLII